MSGVKSVNNNINSGTNTGTNTKKNATTFSNLSTKSANAPNTCKYDHDMSDPRETATITTLNSKPAIEYTYSVRVTGKTASGKKMPVKASIGLSVTNPDGTSTVIQPKTVEGKGSVRVTKKFTAPITEQLQKRLKEQNIDYSKKGANVWVSGDVTPNRGGHCGPKNGGNDPIHED